MGSTAPCKNHKLAFLNQDAPEIKGMEKHGVGFKHCFMCGWIIINKMVKYKHG